ncbi:Tat-linked quality control protein TatD [Marinomonas spartinae]|uniref:Tat-linked quality control protein TatD n=1 Tax=Marinomonas spartinae TaxID=1792290 RepID=A0A1A8TJL3_9GAMM|nr:TatD family hydrolase [Marinomonas spartinae]SBS33979.1 Tat-linked quality control protein TatD [Marinomonas spartinae]
MIDIGVNINHNDYLKDLEDTLQQSYQAGVEGIICIASDLAESKKIQSLCENHPRMWFTLGCHPHQAKSWSASSTEKLNELIAQKRPVAVGETGLDFNRNYSTREEQISAFEQQIDIAKEHNLPLYLHERDAHQEMLTILKRHYHNGVRGVVHCFTGSKEALSAYLDLGLYIGITGWVCDERRGQDLQEAIPHIPNDKLLLETDAPYLLPRNIRPRPKRNHPKYLPWVAAEVARLKGISVDELVQHTQKNTSRLFF